MVYDQTLRKSLDITKFELPVDASFDQACELYKAWREQAATVAAKVTVEKAA